MTKRIIGVNQAPDEWIPENGGERANRPMFASVLLGKESGALLQTPATLPMCADG
jgi:hypothetical protein